MWMCVAESGCSLGVTEKYLVSQMFITMEQGRLGKCGNKNVSGYKDVIALQLITQFLGSHGNSFPVSCD